ncbi:hypothetical protein ACWT_7832 [Actinoplanes sp. SE50]|uniref:hypothetical protein n=1 Tax=unclassified Actinoplanes TaxID=2626549 RepID=UPI00023EDF38|nr:MULTISPECIES: hypothetical protein [unclassified Actinoplanes]AEV88841.1 secreted protein [Actinoplanes sp. SE50/110]ATO87247.1 hypothetical protein ACWT_7832 [Actinoplanes sp. SE50]SLM04665.1 hypothetical protein ACSP50_7972 [Actinoplanes sp. SE50/110]
MATLAGSLAGLAGAGGAMSIALARRPRGSLATGHALIPDRVTDPLPMVLRAGLAGMTVRVTPGPHGELFLGPGDPRPGRTLRRLVLAPLFTRAQATAGRLWADQHTPFQLVVEFAGESRDTGPLLRAYRMLDQQLRDHAALLSRGADGEITPGVVTVTVAGIVDVRDLLAAQPVRYAFADGGFDDLGSPAAPLDLVPTLSEPWTRRFGWDGREPITAEERHLLHALVREAHDEGRAVRMSGLPRGPRRARVAVWSELIAAGVDVVADADLTALVRHLRPVSGG